MGNHGVDPTGAVPLFVAFLSEELFPELAARYRVQPNDRAIYGHSYGGLFGACAFLEHTDLFNRYLILGHFLWFKDQVLPDRLEERSPPIDRCTRLFMEPMELDREIYQYQEAVMGVLRRRKVENVIIHSEVVSNETHRTIFGVGLTNGLRFIYRE
ncbi:MAG: alpha/beta hydrolase-fold protein [Bacteroidota bacterium]